MNALRISGAQAGDRVAMLAAGGLGHLAVQYATPFGFKTIAIARGTDRRDSRYSWPRRYIHSTAGDPTEALQALGGVDLLLSMITNAEAMGACSAACGRRAS